MAGVIALAPELPAQVLRDAPTPAEYPPASYRGTQYVDSKGCVFIRAGMSDYVTWVPRVTRERRQLCGYQPTRVAGATATPPPRPRGRQIVISPTAVPPSTPPAPVPAPVAAPVPRTVAPVAAVPSRTPAPAAPMRPLTLSGTQGGDVVRDRSSFPPNTRVLPLHVWQERQKSVNVPVPRGYERVWTDDRLNPRRAEKSLATARIQPVTAPPRGYEATWDDDRLNRYRGGRSDAQNAATDQVWTDTVPRKLVTPTQTPPVVRVEAEPPGVRTPRDDAGQPFPEINARR